MAITVESNHPNRVNPFATRYVAPGAVPWWGGAQSLEALRTRFGELSGRAAIIGPHGSGKSTLLEHLVPHLGHVVFRAGPTGERVPVSGPTGVSKPIVWIVLRRDQGPMRQLRASMAAWRYGGLLVADGFEQLGRTGQWWTIISTRRRGMGLLATAHRPVALRLLTQTYASVTVAQQVIAQAFRNAGLEAGQAWLEPERVERLLADEAGNLREVLMRLYDSYADGLPK